METLTPESLHSRPLRRRPPLPSLIADGKITEVAASAQQIESVVNFFTPSHARALGAGELEALAILQSSEEEILFCTADKLAIDSLVLMGFWERGVSLEEVLRETGLPKAIGLQFTEAFFRHQIALGQEKRIRGEGLRR